MSKHLDIMDPMDIVEKCIQKIGKKIVLGSPLAIGKANNVINAFYQKALNDQSIDLTICTALTLEKPTGKSDLEQRFLAPFSERVFGDYPDLDYEKARMSNKLPDNIRVIEFYFPPGKYVRNDTAQKHYISSNYTHVMRDMMDRGINVITQIVSKQEIEGVLHYSLSCNPDVTMDLIDNLNKKKREFVSIAQVNQNLPFMFGDSVVKHDYYDFVLDDPQKYFKLFGPPKASISPTDFMIGFYSSLLVKDDGEIQIGIGSLGDSTVYSLLLRHKENKIYQQLIQDLNVKEKYGSVVDRIGDTGVFETGLFGASEMLVDGFQHLYEAGIVKKKAYDHVGLQKLINKGLIKEEFEDNILEVLLENKIIRGQMKEEDFDFLVEWGIFHEELEFNNGFIITQDGSSIKAYLRDQISLEAMKTQCLGTNLKNGQIMQGGFFLGPQSFYSWLKELPEDERKLINMKSVLKINQLYGHEALDRLHRKNARFVNSCMMQTLLGAAVSDGLEDGKVISGVGGQYNFVAMAQELPDGHSILNLRSTRKRKNKIESNIVPYYGHLTIPRHLRDIVVTEYGIAFIRGCTDEEIIKKLLNICDSRFQEALRKWAVKVGKLDKEYRIPFSYSNNYPEVYEAVIKKYQKQGYFSAFPFGTDLTEKELAIGKALKSLKSDLSSKPKLLKTLIRGIFKKATERDLRLLKRMDLDKTSSIKEWIYQKLLLSKL